MEKNFKDLLSCDVWRFPFSRMIHLDVMFGDCAALDVCTFNRSVRKK